MCTSCTYGYWPPPGAVLNTRTGITGQLPHKLWPYVSFFIYIYYFMYFFFNCHFFSPPPNLRADFAFYILMTMVCNHEISKSKVSLFPSKITTMYATVYCTRWWIRQRFITNVAQDYNRTYPISGVICVLPVFRGIDHRQGRCWIPEPTISYALNTFKTQKKVFYISWA